MVNSSSGDVKDVEPSDDLTNALNVVLQVHRWFSMSIVASMKVFPEDVIIGPAEVKEAIKAALPSDITLHKVEEEPIAFGLVALIIHVIVPDTGGDELGKIEGIIRKVKGVSEVETLLVRRI